MPLDVTPLVTPPNRTAVLVCEMQNGALNRPTSLANLVKAVEETGLKQRLATFLDCARAAGAEVVYCNIVRPLNAKGTRGAGVQPRTTGRERAQGSPEELARNAEVIPELTPKPSDVISARIHGWTPFSADGLDQTLRNMGIETLIPTGVSLNGAVLGACIGAANHGYRIVFACDLAAAAPREYADQVIEYSIRPIAVLTTADELMRVWTAD